MSSPKSTDNKAAWQVAEKAHPFEIKSAPMGQPSAHEILIRNHAIAINPLDNMLQTAARFPLAYPNIFGQDVAGEVVAIGNEVSRFKVGDRVVGHAVGLVSKRAEENAFQNFTILNTSMASPIPNSMPFENAAVLPLGLSTAACGLFQPSPFLALQLPTAPPQKPKGECVLIWGGSSSVGSNAIQLCIAAGYTVISTSSAKNFEYVKKLGAEQIFDYTDPSTPSSIISALKGKKLAGALDCIGGPACVSCVSIVHAVSGSGAVATTKGGCDDPPEGVTVKRIFGTTLKDNFVGPAIYQDFLPKALADGSFVPNPKPRVVGSGLESVQMAVDEMGRGVSAEKLVVTL